ncbi:MAG: Uma2 family endonuclease [Defluviitaleaceae bacterium]|nr:Uma2 family endonuclease [Defluviitaleaceae bacterium]
MVMLAEKINTTTYYTYADYEKWPEYPRFELIKGEAFEMSAPTLAHQEITVALTLQIGNYLRGKKCKLVAAPFDVRINYDTADNTVVQPDLVVVCDLSKIENGKHCLGAPDMAIEILSETSHRHDKLKKFNIYLEAGVREYWVVDPDARGVQVHILEDGRYFTKAYDSTATIPVHVLEGCNVNLAEVFEPEESP